MEQPEVPESGQDGHPEPKPKPADVQAMNKPKKGSKEPPTIDLSQPPRRHPSWSLEVNPKSPTFYSLRTNADSLLNSDFKVASGLEAGRLKQMLTHTLSPLQLVAGNDRRIHHGINLARNAIFAAGKLTRSGCGIADTDYQAAFDSLVMS